MSRFSSYSTKPPENSKTRTHPQTGRYYQLHTYTHLKRKWVHGVVGEMYTCICISSSTICSLNKCVLR